MSNYLLLDGDAIQNAFKAGGIPLVDQYLNFAEARGFTNFVMTDFVFVRELRGFAGVVDLKNYLDTRGIVVATTAEAALASSFDAGLNPGYIQTNGGERSIIEVANQLQANGNGFGILSEDKYFDNVQLLRNTAVSPEMRLTNADFVKGMNATGFITDIEFNTIKNDFRTNVGGPYDPNASNHSVRLDTFDVQGPSLTLRGLPSLTSVVNTLKSGASSILVLGAGAALLSIVISNNAEAKGLSFADSASDLGVDINSGTLQSVAASFALDAGVSLAMGPFGLAKKLWELYQSGQDVKDLAQLAGAAFPENQTIKNINTLIEGAEALKEWFGLTTVKTVDPASLVYDPMSGRAVELLYGGLELDDTSSEPSAFR